MTHHFFRVILCLLTCVCSNTTFGQAGLCPDNLDFERGDFTNWECKWGNVIAAGGINIPQLTNTGEVPNRHTIISSAESGLDPYGRFPKLCPNGSGYSIQLGNSAGGAQAESVSYTYSIPSTLTNFSMLFHYAIVLYNPNHTDAERPRFRARITDLSTGATIPCVDFDFIPSSSLPGFQPSPTLPEVIYKAWTPVTINLNAFIGRTIKLEFITSDCTLSAHFGYAYIDVNTNCNGAIKGATLCQGDNSITLSAPNGFQNYVWYADNSFTTVLSNTQDLPLNPAPAIGTVLPVVVTPYAGFGCKDTLYATIGIAPKPVSAAGPDVTICNNVPVNIGGASNTGHQYEWIEGFSSPVVVSNPLITSVSTSPTRFILKTTDILTGCYSYDTTFVSSATVNAALTITGKPDYCDGGSPPTLNATTSSGTIQWYHDLTPLPGENGATYTPSTDGPFWAEASNNGCKDSTEIVDVLKHFPPTVLANLSEDSACVTNNSFTFNGTANVADGSALSYQWTFTDGSTASTEDVVKNFSNPGRYRGTLTVTSAFGCAATADTVVVVMPNNIPDFTWDSICTQRPVVFRNLSNENGSPTVNYKWTFNDGGTGSILRVPLPVTYTTPGAVNVELEMTSFGCETAPQKIIKTVQVNQASPGITYKSITVPEGASQFIHAREMSNYSWRPKQQLSSYNTRYTEFRATAGDITYYIDVTDKHTCVTTDTLSMLVLKKPGYYLPTAFTPNGDGLNDVAIPYLVGMKSLKSFSVYNRWGNLIFYTNRPNEGWNGKSNGVDQDAGVYVWVLEYFDNSNKKIMQRGTIAVVR